MSKTLDKQELLAANQLAKDPRIAEAKRLIIEAVEEHRAQLNEIKHPNDELGQEYIDRVNDFGDKRGGGLWFPYISSGLGNGPFVELADGSVKLDMITGIGVHGFGHSDPRIIDAGIDAALCDTVMQGNLQQNMPSYELTELLLNTANQSKAGFEHCFLSTSGAMANENALKIAFQKHQPADRIIAFDHCFAGRTLALAQLTDKAAYRNGLPQTINVDYLRFYDSENPEKSTEGVINRLLDFVDRYPGRYAAIWMELIQGEGGYYPGDRDFFLKIVEICKKNNIAVIADEVQTFCRTTRPFAYQHFGLDEHIDIVTIGKISQVCATIFKADYKPKPGLISQTFTASSWAILAGKAIIQGLLDGGNFGDDGLNTKLHNHFVDHFKRINEKYPGSINGPHGLGGMVAFTPFNGHPMIAKQMVLQMFGEGLLGFMAGGIPARIRFLMPLGCTTLEHIDLAAEVIERVVASTVEQLEAETNA